MIFFSLLIKVLIYKYITQLHTYSIVITGEHWDVTMGGATNFKILQFLVNKRLVIHFTANITAPF